MFKYLCFYCGFLFLFCFPLFLNFLLLRNSGEFEDFTKIAKIQEQTQGLYGSAIDEDFFHYKMELFKNRQADIVAIGSSRVLQFRKNFFSRSFSNLGNTINSIAEAPLAFETMLKIKKPKMVLFGVDFWWFNDELGPLQTSLNSEVSNPRFTSAALIKPFWWLLRNKILVSDYISYLTQATDFKRMGIRAIKTGAGTGPDGSYYYNDISLGNNPPSDLALIRDSLEEIKLKRGHYRSIPHASKKHLKILIDLLISMKKRDVPVLVFFPPLAPQVFDAMTESGAYGFIDEIKEELARNEIHLFDFHNARDLGSSDCEFFDGHHAGVLTSAKLLQNLSNSSPDFKADTNVNYLAGVQEIFENVASIPDEISPIREEIDFQHLGCKKRWQTYETSALKGLRSTDKTY